MKFLKALLLAFSIISIGILIVVILIGAFMINLILGIVIGITYYAIFLASILVLYEIV